MRKKTILYAIVSLIAFLLVVLLATLWIIDSVFRDVTNSAQEYAEKIRKTPKRIFRGPLYDRLMRQRGELLDPGNVRYADGCLRACSFG
jgi:hypothetical protein